MSDYTDIGNPYNNLLNRTDQDTGVFPTTGSIEATVIPPSVSVSVGSTQTSTTNGSVETQPVKSSGSSSDVWIKNFIRSDNWKPKKVGFYIDGQSGYAEFTNVFVSGNIQALTGTIGSFTIGEYLYTGDKLKFDDAEAGIHIGADGIGVGNNVFTVSAAGDMVATSANISGTITATAGTIGSFTIGTYLYTDLKLSYDDAQPGVHIGSDGIGLGEGYFSVSAAGDLIAMSATIVGTIIAASGDIGGWEIQPDLLRSASSGVRIELNKGENRISIFDAVNEKVVMGYLDGLPKNDGTGDWGVGDYGFWARAGDKLSIDGDGEYVDGDWIVQNDSNYLINDSSNNTIVRLGTDSMEKGLFIYDTAGTQIAKYTSIGILVGDTSNNLKYDDTNGLTLNDAFVAETDLSPGAPVMILKNGKIARVAGSIASTDSASFDRMIGFTKEFVTAGNSTLIQRSGILSNYLYYESQLTYINSGYSCYSTIWLAQSFTPTSTMTFTSAKIRVFKSGTGAGEMTLAVKEVDVNGKPTGAELASGTFESSDITTSMDIIVAFASPMTLTSGVDYAIILYSTAAGGDSSNKINWFYSTGNPYPIGSKVSSSNSGSTWTVDTTIDFYFSILGTIIGFTPGSMYKIKNSYTSSIRTINQSSKNSTADLNLVVEQTFKPLRTFLNTIYVFLEAGSAGAGTYNYNLKIYDSDNVIIFEKDTSAAVTSTPGYAYINTFNADNDRVLVCPGETYRLVYSSAVADQILISYQDTDVYADGSITIDGTNYPDKDLYFDLYEVYGSGSVVVDVADGNSEFNNGVGIAIEAGKILLKSFPRWK